MTLIARTRLTCTGISTSKDHALKIPSQLARLQPGSCRVAIEFHYTRVRIGEKAGAFEIGISIQSRSRDKYALNHLGIPRIPAAAYLLN